MYRVHFIDRAGKEIDGFGEPYFRDAVSEVRRLFGLTAVKVWWGVKTHAEVGTHKAVIVDDNGDVVRTVYYRQDSC